MDFGDLIVILLLWLDFDSVWISMIWVVISPISMPLSHGIAVLTRSRVSPNTGSFFVFLVPVGSWERLWEAKKKRPGRTEKYSEIFKMYQTASKGSL